jgi:hypothetical protein
LLEHNSLIVSREAVGAVYDRALNGLTENLGAS